MIWNSIDRSQGPLKSLPVLPEPSLRVQQDAAVARARLPIAPGHAAPPELDDESIVSIRLLRQESAPDLTTDSDRRRAVDLIDDAEHALRDPSEW